MRLVITIDLPDGATFGVQPAAALNGGQIAAAYEYDPEYDPERDPLPADPGEDLAPLPPIAAPVQRTMATQQPNTGWQPGAMHAPGHKPLKGGNKGGLFCPTKLTDGSWCQFRA